jgi:hypothetical protein
MIVIRKYVAQFLAKNKMIQFSLNHQNGTFGYYLALFENIFLATEWRREENT